MKKEIINILNQEGQLVVTSREVAKNFEKEHRNVLRDVDNLITQMGGAQNCAYLFIETEYENEQNFQLYREFLLTRDGFSLLVMGFTGAKALTWKLKYIEAFNKMEEGLKNPYAGLSPELQSIFAIDKKQQETEKKVNSLEKEFIEFKNETPLFNIECEELTKATKKKGIEILGGYNSPAYKDKSLRGKVYADIHAEIKRNFGVKSYKAIKRSQLDKAYLIIQEHKAPLCLSDEIQAINNQMSYL